MSVTSIIKAEYPYPLPIKLYRGNTWDKQVYIKDGGVLQDISADNISLTVTNTITGNIVLTMTMGNGLSTPSLGLLNIHFTAVQTVNMPIERMEYELKWSRSNGEILSLFAGSVEVKGKR